MAKVWTYVYKPFTMGGKVYHPEGFHIENPEIVDLGKGFSGFVVTSPKGKTVVVEERSGAIVGSSLDDVRKDIETADVEVMEKQVQEACNERVEIISEEHFWKIYKG